MTVRPTTLTGDHMITFAILGAVGVIGLLLSLLVGELLDALDFHEAGFSSTAMFVFLTVFGSVGFIGLSSGWGLPVAILASFVAGLLLSVLSQKVIDRLTDSSDGDAKLDATELQGVATATVTRNGGEVRLDGAQELESRLAWADEVIPAGTRVIVVEQSGSRVRVKPAA